MKNKYFISKVTYPPYLTEGKRYLYRKDSGDLLKFFSDQGNYNYIGENSDWIRVGFSLNINLIKVL